MLWKAIRGKKAIILAALCYYNRIPLRYEKVLSKAVNSSNIMLMVIGEGKYILMMTIITRIFREIRDCPLKMDVGASRLT